MSPKKPLSIAFALLLIGVALRAACGGASRSGDELLADRVWIDHLPEKSEEHYEIFAVVSDEDAAGRGVFNRGSAYEGAYALFGWKRKDAGKLDLVMLQDKKRHAVKYAATRCDVPPFDYCLTIEGAPRGARTYFSRDGWEIGGDSGSASAEVDAWRRSHGMPSD